ncbi:MAG: hypothetical protein EOP04_06965 [Proteobacteria bacterium]|nr:MAG: hypothetical protein EOP04_06965 [Pseudomonadota bacterium]
MKHHQTCRDKILSEFYRSKEIEDLIQKMHPEHLREELRQELFLTLCEMPEEKLSAMYLTKQLRFYITRIVLNMVQSSSSPFFKKYRKMLVESLDAPALRRNLEDKSDHFAAAATFGYQSRLIAESADDEAERMDEELRNNALLEAVEKALGECHWYTRELFKLYVHHGSAGKVIKAMKEDLDGRYIPRRTILDVVKKAKAEIKQHSEVQKVVAA